MSQRLRRNFVHLQRKRGKIGQQLKQSWSHFVAVGTNTPCATRQDIQYTTVSTYSTMMQTLHAPAVDLYNERTATNHDRAVDETKPKCPQQTPHSHTPPHFPQTTIPPNAAPFSRTNKSENKYVSYSMAVSYVLDGKPTQ